LRWKRNNLGTGFCLPAREEDLEGLYREVTGTGSANTQTEEKPCYLKAAETRSASYPTPDCLTTDEIQACVSGNLPTSNRIRHAESCEGCQSVFEAIQPSPAVVFELMEDVRLAARVTGHTRSVAAASGDDSSQAMTLRAAALFHK
jgi:hypothetical protein